MKNLSHVYDELKTIFQPYAAKLDTKTDTAIELYVNTRHIQKNKKPLFFGAVQINKNYVGYYLMPVYVDRAYWTGFLRT
jgi:hypothetical protein